MLAGPQFIPRDCHRDTMPVGQPEGGSHTGTGTHGGSLAISIEITNVTALRFISPSSGVYPTKHLCT